MPGFLPTSDVPDEEEDEGGEDSDSHSQDEPHEDKREEDEQHEDEREEDEGEGEEIDDDLLSQIGIDLANWSEDRRYQTGYRRPIHFRDDQREEARAKKTRGQRERGNLIDVKRFTYTSVLADCFGRIICDEGHRIKSARTRTHRAIVALRAPYHWVISATPMMNRASDLIGYLNFFWRPEWMPEELTTTHPDYYTEACWESMSSQYRSKYSAPLYRLNPAVFAALANRAAIKANEAVDATAQRKLTVAIRAILRLVQLRRTMASQIQDCHGVTKRIGGEIKSYFITTVELEMNSHEQRAHDLTWSRFSRYLGVATGAKAKFKTNRVKPAADEPSGIRDARICRLFTMMAHDLKWARYHNVAECTRARDVQDWPSRDMDYGATHFYQHTKPAPYLPVYADRYSMAQYFLTESPKLRYCLAVPVYETLFNRAADNRPGKCIIYTGYPALQWEVECLLRLCGLEFCSLKASMSDGERKAEVDEFNKFDNNKMFLIASVRTGALGLNLQKAADKIVVIDYPDSIGITIQIVGRVHRLGQMFEQRCWVITLRYSYDQLLQANAARKFIPQLLGEALLPTPTVEMDDSIENEFLRQERYDEQMAQQQWVNAAELARSVMGQHCRVDMWTDLNLQKARKDDPPLDLATARATVDFASLETPRSRRIADLDLAPASASDVQVTPSTSPTPEKGVHKSFNSAKVPPATKKVDNSGPSRKKPSKSFPPGLGQDVLISTTSIPSQDILTHTTPNPANCWSEPEVIVTPRSKGSTVLSKRRARSPSPLSSADRMDVEIGRRHGYKIQPFERDSEFAAKTARKKAERVRAELDAEDESLSSDGSETDQDERNREDSEVKGQQGHAAGIKKDGNDDDRESDESLSSDGSETDQDDRNREDSEDRGQQGHPLGMEKDRDDDDRESIDSEESGPETWPYYRSGGIQSDSDDDEGVEGQ
ncbi:MAG: hypothetical protein M1823_006268 [Watsoniomyces obsoletus]|nr:MAG: hypothetical protein M1823_006268 [Watsoniomyces obsoletus]